MEKRIRKNILTLVSLTILSCIPLISFAGPVEELSLPSAGGLEIYVVVFAIIALWFTFKTNKVYGIIALLSVIGVAIAAFIFPAVAKILSFLIAVLSILIFIVFLIGTLNEGSWRSR
jgi:hypothetical protein